MYGNQNLQLQQDKVNQFKSALTEVETNADKFFKEYSDNRNAIAQTRENLKQEYNRLRNLPTNQRFKRENLSKAIFCYSPNFMLRYFKPVSLVRGSKTCLFLFYNLL